MLQKPKALKRKLEDKMPRYEKFKEWADIRGYSEEKRKRLVKFWNEIRNGMAFLMKRHTGSSLENKITARNSWRIAHVRRQLWKMDLKERKKFCLELSKRSPDLAELVAPEDRKPTDANTPDAQMVGRP